MKTPLSELDIQRLVDGELSPAARTQLLDRLESENGAESWRTVALGFLEHQQLRVSLPDDTRAEPAPAVQRQPSWTLRMARQTAMLAASALLGVSVVLVSHNWLRGPAGANVAGVASVDPTGNPNSGGGEASAPPRTETRVARPVPVMNVNLGGAPSGDGPSVSVPVYTPEDWPAAHGAHSESGLSPELQRQLESQGYRIERHPEWYSAPLDDGGQVLIPAERLRIHPEVN